MDPRVARGPVDRGAEHADLVVHGGLVDVRGRASTSTGEKRSAEPPVAADEGEPAAAVQRRRDRGVPVGAHAERPRAELPAAAVGGEDDGHVGHRRGPLREQRLRLGARQPANVDARDLRADASSTGEPANAKPDPERHDESAPRETAGEVPRAGRAHRRSRPARPANGDPPLKCAKPAARQRT